MPTLEGVIFVPLALYFFLLRPSLLFPLLIISTVFQASSIVSSGSIGIQPYYCVALLFVIRFLPTKGRRWERLLGGYSFMRLWISFAVVSAISAIVLPFVFHGIPVYDPRLSIEENFVQGPAPLHFQFENIVQPAFLALNVLVVIASTRQCLSIGKAHKMFIWSSYLIILIVMLQGSFFWLGLPFPSNLLNNNPGYSLVQMQVGNLRPSGSFTEPSTAGAVLAALVAAFLWKYFAGGAGILKAGIAAFTCLLVASTSSLLAVIIVFVLLVLAFPVLRLPWFIRVGRLKRLSVFFVSTIVAALLMIIPGIRAILLSQTLEKGESYSALVRLGADAYAFNLALETYGLGVGLGSNRPSSLVAALLSQVGVVGFVLFVCAAWSTLWNLPKQHRWIGMAGLGLLLSMAFGLPDLSFPFVWILFALAAQSKAARTVTSSSESLVGQGCD
jgi:hypothetical protein